jgi:protoporphyrinogen IX oxidase
MDGYSWFRALHVMSVIAWMAGLFYLPRLYVYHTQQAVGSQTSAVFKVMERKLLSYIMTPAMIASWLFGLILAIGYIGFHDAWFHVKLLMVVLMTVFHLLLVRWRSAFAADANQHSERFYRMINEVPTLLMIVIVVMVIVKPF